MKYRVILSIVRIDEEIRGKYNAPHIATLASPTITQFEAGEDGKAMLIFNEMEPNISLRIQNKIKKLVEDLK